MRQQIYRIIGLLALFLALVGCKGNASKSALGRTTGVAMGTGRGFEHINHLIGEHSPYLLQHAHNPVDWYPWCEEALSRARAEDKPIFLSIGYSTCHWCHVMERESFENEGIAALMNEFFICIKVDREERPDLDEIYMAAVQAMTGRGGWPMSVFLTPDLKPFFGGTYFPPEDRYGRPGFRSILEQMHQLWTSDRSRVMAAAAQLSSSLDRLGRGAPAEGAFDLQPVEQAYQKISASFDARDGGWGSAPKFPRADYGSLCLRQYRRTGDERALSMALITLRKMAAGGIYDHLGGGFARYSTDARWFVPHFEKMLYDNAQLAFHYLEAYQLTGDPHFARVARETLDYVLRDMTSPQGGFYSAEDADSEGQEGRFYLWSASELSQLLPEELLKPFVAAYGVTEEGNWEGSNILHRDMDDHQLAGAFSISEDEVASRLARARAILLPVRSQRIRPARDDKVLAAWNGLMIRAMARGSVVLDEPRYLRAAIVAGDFLMEQMQEDGRLLRRWREGVAGIDAYAEDYAMVVSGFIELYQDSFELRFLKDARRLHRRMMEDFAGSDGALFNTREGGENLLVRVKAGYDGATPTASSVAAVNMLALYELTGEEEYARQNEKSLRAFWGTMLQSPFAMTRLVIALDCALAERAELVLAGEESAVAALRTKARQEGYHPDLFISYASRTSESLRLMPVLEGKGGEGATMAYVCRGFSCRLPTTDEREMLAQLGLSRARTP